MARKKKNADDEQPVVEQLSDDQLQAELLQRLVAIEDIDCEIEALKSARKAQVEAAKASGFSTKDLNFVLKLRRGNDKEALEQRRREQQLAKWINHPIGLQAELFVKEASGPLIAAAKRLGKQAGMEGKPCKSNHAPGSELDQTWIEAWHQGQAVNASGIKAPKAKPADDGFSDVIEDALHDPVTGEVGEDIPGFLQRSASQPPPG